MASSKRVINGKFQSGVGAKFFSRFGASSPSILRPCVDDPSSWGSKAKDSFLHTGNWTVTAKVCPSNHYVFEYKSIHTLPFLTLLTDIVTIFSFDWQWHNCNCDLDEKGEKKDIWTKKKEKANRYKKWGGGGEWQLGRRLQTTVGVAVANDIWGSG